MTRRTRTTALVLRTRAFQDDDLIVDLLCHGLGRVSVVARGARKGGRRSGGPIEMGSRVDIDVWIRPGQDLHRLTRCEVLLPIRNIRAHLERITALAYVLELVRLSAREGQADDALLGLALGIVDALELEDPSPEGLLLWEIALLAHQGYATSPDALARDANLDEGARETLERLWRGDRRARLDPQTAARLRLRFELLWERAVGHVPRSGRFLTQIQAAA